MSELKRCWKFSLPSLIRLNRMLYRPCRMGELHTTDTETLKFGDSYYTPHGSGLSAYIKPNVFYPGLAGTMTTIPQSPRHKHQSTHQQSLPALTTSSPLNQIRPGLEAASTQCSRFRKTHTCWHIFPHRMCLNFIFCVPVVIFHCIGDGAKSFNMFLKNIFLYDNSSV